LITRDPALLSQIEAITHPIVHQDRQNFIASNSGSILVFDIPLLLELNSEAEFDSVACVLVSSVTQKVRVMARAGMTEAHFKMLSDKQLPAAEKVARADYIIDTTSPATTTMAVDMVMEVIKRKLENA
jgi:dephospho-CoA kinase